MFIIVSRAGLAYSSASLVIANSSGRDDTRSVVWSGDTHSGGAKVEAIALAAREEAVGDVAIAVIPPCPAIEVARA